MPSTTLLDELRQRIKDVRYNVRAFGLAVSDSSATSALAQITNGHLLVTVLGGTAPSIDFDLTNPRYDTVGKLYEVLSRINGYAINLDEDAELDHPAVDLFPINPVNVQTNGIDLRHRLFADSEIEMVLNQAIQRHNPTFSITTLPSTEHVFVLALAHANVLRIQAQDAAKRKGLDQTVSDLLEIASSYEKSYKDDVTRLARAIVSPKESPQGDMREGDIVIGHLYRSAGRTGFMSPLGQNLPPSAADIFDADWFTDIEDTNIRCKWARNRDFDFYSMELWMDTRPQVVRTQEGLIFTALPFSERPYSGSTNPLGTNSTSKMVFRSFGANSNYNAATFATFVEEFGQQITSFRVGCLEPDSDYYFRLYIVDLNYEPVASKVIKATTKSLRTRFACPSFLSSSSGAAGAVITVNFDTTMGAIPMVAGGLVDSRWELRLGGIVCPMTYVGPYTATFVVPSFVNMSQKKDVSIQSPNLLVDVQRCVFQVLSS